MSAMRIATENAGRFDHIHGDEDQGRPLSAFEQTFIEHRARELIAERLRDRKLFYEVTAGIDSEQIDCHLHRALMNLDPARKGERIGIDAVLSALSEIQKLVEAGAEICWQTECETLAQMELPR